MFNKSQLEAYSSIKAPHELYEKVTKEKSNKSKIYLIPLVSSLAACLILIFGVAVFNGSNYSPEVYIAGSELTRENTVIADASTSVYARSASVHIPVELNLSKKTEISVSDGLIVLQNGETADKVTLKGSVAFVWELDLPAEEVQRTLTLKCFGGTSNINLTQYTDGSYTAEIN